MIECRVTSDDGGDDAIAEGLAETLAQFELLTLYQKFEHISVLVLTGLIAIVIALAIWHLALKILFSIFSSTFDPHRLRRLSIRVRDDLHRHHRARVQALAAGAGGAPRQRRAGPYRRADHASRRRAKLIILDLAQTEALQLFALAAAILALGSVYWLVGDYDRRRRT